MDARLRKAVTIVVGSLLLGVFAGGCQNNKKGDYDALLVENTELRDRIASLQGDLGQRDAARAQLERDNREMADALEQMRRELQDRPGSGLTIDGTSVSARGTDIVVEIAGDVLFDSGSATLKPDARRTLDRVASAISSRFPGSRIRVEGYTDTDPIRKSNWGTNERLSFERAYAVEQYLVGKGVHTDRIYSAAFGPSNPKGTKAQSRRVEVVILGN